MYNKIHSLSILYEFSQIHSHVIHRNKDIESSVTHLPIPLYPFVINLSPQPQLQTNTDQFSVSIVLPVPECHVNGIIQYVSLSLTSFT